MTQTEFEVYLHEHIPISAAMGVEVLQFDPAGVLLKAPLRANINHRASAFGGSISSVLTLSAWALIYKKMIDLDTKNTIVIQDSQMKFYLPVKDDFIASTLPIPTDQWQRFSLMYQKFSKGRLKVEAVIRRNEEILAHFSGRFVVVSR